MQWLDSAQNRTKRLVSTKQRHNLGFFLVLTGPDGSGKTTLANKLMTSEAFKKIFLNNAITIKDSIFYLN
jgi:adenylylsulfate kinase-like enzyme